MRKVKDACQQIKSETSNKMYLYICIPSAQQHVVNFLETIIFCCEFDVQSKVLRMHTPEHFYNYSCLILFTELTLVIIDNN